jgi:hypothetical protein
MTAPFVYPPAAHQRRHGPQGYADYASYRPWLRDEFCFRCVYCLVREMWSRHGSLGIDHFLAVAHDPAKVNDYDNLLYACDSCNAAKGKRLLPDPTSVLTSPAVHVAEDGTIHAATAEAVRLIELAGLGSAQSIEFRMLWIGIIALAARHDLDLYRKLMGFPDDLPNLARLRPPAGNLRPEGAEQSYELQKQTGTLPAAY